MELIGAHGGYRYATRKVHLKVSGEQSEAKPFTVQKSYLITFERGRALGKFAVQKNWIFHSDQNREKQGCFPSSKPLHLNLCT